MERWGGWKPKGRERGRVSDKDVDPEPNVREKWSLEDRRDQPRGVDCFLNDKTRTRLLVPRNLNQNSGLSVMASWMNRIYSGWLVSKVTKLETFWKLQISLKFLTLGNFASQPLITSVAITRLRWDKQIVFVRADRIIRILCLWRFGKLWPGIVSEGCGRILRFLHLLEEKFKKYLPCSFISRTAPSITQAFQVESC